MSDEQLNSSKEENSLISFEIKLKEGDDDNFIPEPESMSEKVRKRMKYKKICKIIIPIILLIIIVFIILFFPIFISFNYRKWNL